MDKIIMNNTSRSNFFKQKAFPIFQKRSMASDQIQGMIDELQSISMSGNQSFMTPDQVRGYVTRVNTLIQEVRKIRKSIEADIVAIQKLFNATAKRVLVLGGKSIADVFLYSTNVRVTNNAMINLRKKFRKQYGVAGDIMMRRNAIPVMNMNRSMTVIKNFVDRLKGIPPEELKVIMGNREYIKKGIASVRERTTRLSNQLSTTTSNIRRKIANGRLPKNMLPLVQKLEKERANLNKNMNTRVGRSNAATAVAQPNLNVVRVTRAAELLPRRQRMTQIMRASGISVTPRNTPQAVANKVLLMNKNSNAYRAIMRIVEKSPQ